MGSNVLDLTEKGDPPLTRADVEQLLLKVGSSRKLDLRGQNLRGIDLSGMNLVGSFFSEADLTKANLSRANLSEAVLNGTNLSMANLQEADLYNANLREADLDSCNLDRADLRGASLDGADLWGCSVRGTIMYDYEKKQLLKGAIIGLEQINENEESSANLDQIDMRDIRSTATFHIRVVEDPLTARNLNMIISTLTELSTKYWLIAKGRFADLIEYTQTHNGRFAEEANVVVTKISYNSPMHMDWKVDLSAPSVAEALVTTIDGIVQVRKRLDQADLTNQAKVQEIKHAEQQADHEQQMAALEREQQRLALEQRRLEILEKQLEVQKKGIEYALEIAGKVVDTLHPSADPATRAMEIQSLLPNLIQLQNVKGLELILPTSPPKTE